MIMKIVQGIPRYRTNELTRMPVIAQGQADDLHYEGVLPNKGLVRLWLSRCGIADGEPFKHTVSVELFNRRTGMWVTSYRYDGDHPMTVVEA